MKQGWPTVRLGEVLTRRQPDVAVQANESYQFAGVYSFGRGVFRGVQRNGGTFAYKTLTRLRRENLVYPKLMAWEGAFGVVPPECEGCYVSPEFPVFEIDQGRLSAAFLGNYFRIPSVWESISGPSTGTNVRRRRLNPADLLRREIPLPPLAEQRRVVARIEELAAEIREAFRIRQEVLTDQDALLRSAFRQIADTAPRKPMNEVAPLQRRPVSVNVVESYPQVAVRSFGRGTFHKPPLAGSEVTWQKPFLVKSADILMLSAAFSRINIRRTLISALRLNSSISCRVEAPAPTSSSRLTTPLRNAANDRATSHRSRANVMASK